MTKLHVLVPLDNTPTSLKALDAVRTLAMTVDSCIVELLHVEQLEQGVAEDEREARQALAEDFLTAQAATLVGPKLHVSTRLAWGEPAEAILQRLRAERFDFMCMTTRAVPNNTAEPGSVAARLFRESPVPIIALPARPPASDAGEHPERAYFRAAVQLPATLEVEGIKHPVRATVRDLGAKGAELAAEIDQPLPSAGCTLILTLPTRAEPLEIALGIVAAEPHTSDSGEPLQILHVSFPSISVSAQDAIVAFLNKLRMFEQQQRRVSAPVRMEVVTGPRAYAVFKGRTRVVRPDYVWLRMDRFDHIEGADVSLVVQSADGAAAVELDATVTSVKGGEQGFEVEAEVAEAAVGREDPGQRLMAFVRQHYGAEDEPAPATAGQPLVLIPRPVRAHRPAQRAARMLTAAPAEASVPMRAPRSAPEVPLKRRVRAAEERALESILRPHRPSPPLRSI